MPARLSCSRLRMPRQDSKFWRSVRPQENGCWLWQGRQRGTGAKYGVLQRGKESISAHRHAFYLANGREASKCVCHSCDTPLCCNPEHLWEGSHQENMDDKMSKGRHRFSIRRGSASKASRLRESEVTFIKCLLGHGVSHSEIAAIYGVAETTISSISGGYSWKRIPSWPNVLCSAGEPTGQPIGSQVRVS